MHSFPLALDAPVARHRQPSTCDLRLRKRGALSRVKDAVRGLLFTAAWNGAKSMPGALGNGVKIHGIRLTRSSHCTDGMFSGEPTLLSLPLVVVQNQERVWRRQKNGREAGGATTTCAGSLPIWRGLSRGLLATDACMFFHDSNRLWCSAKLATRYLRMRAGVLKARASPA
jgi:hypothetical protein